LGIHPVGLSPQRGTDYCDYNAESKNRVFHWIAFILKVLFVIFLPPNTGLHQPVPALLVHPVIQQRLIRSIASRLSTHSTINGKS
jgi:hypothetical protein